MTLVLLDPDAEPRVVPRIPRGDARREHALRDLIHANPGIMPVHELDPSYGRLFTVAKELTIPDVGFVDVVLADERGRLVVIECKLWRNPQARREVVGQILDYARALARFSYEDLQRQISIATKRRGNVLFELAREAGSDLAEPDFVDRVSRDLAAGRFLLLVVGDGITEGTRRIGEFLGGQPGLAFEFGLVEMAEYRFTDGLGVERVIVQPRLLAQTTMIERHAIRLEVPGLLVAPVEAELPRTSGGVPSESARAWGAFVDRFAAETSFDDPGQPAPRRGGNGWIRLPLPIGLHINLYRSTAAARIGAEVSFQSADARVAWEALLAEREAIDAEVAALGEGDLEWLDGTPPRLLLTHASPLPWSEEAEATQRAWLGRVANQLVNSLRPRVARIATT